MITTKRIKLAKLTTLIILMIALTGPTIINNIRAAYFTTPEDVVEQPTEEPSIEETPIILNNIPVLFSELSYKPLYDIKLCTEYINVVRSAVLEVGAAIDSNSYSVTAVAQMRQEAVRLYRIIMDVEADIEQYTKWETEYYYAAKTWEFLMQHGYSEEVASGIIGNMMIETGGHTLDLKPTRYSPKKSYYGLCQWSMYYKPFMADTTFEQQLDYLLVDMQAEFDKYGFCYKSGFDYASFLVMEDPEEAALAFAKVYERCNTSSHNLRKWGAGVAYEYFVLATAN